MDGPKAGRTAPRKIHQGEVPTTAVSTAVGMVSFKQLIGRIDLEPSQCPIASTFGPPITNDRGRGWGEDNERDFGRYLNSSHFSGPKSSAGTNQPKKQPISFRTFTTASGRRTPDPPQGPPPRRGGRGRGPRPDGSSRRTFHRDRPTHRGTTPRRSLQDLPGNDHRDDSRHGNDEGERDRRNDAEAGHLEHEFHRGTPPGLEGGGGEGGSTGGWGGGVGVDETFSPNLCSTVHPVDISVDIPVDIRARITPVIHTLCI